MNISQKIKIGDFKKIKGTGASDVWNYFDKLSNTATNEIEPFVVCRRCEKIFKFGKGSSPSNLKKHSCYKRQTEEGRSSSPLIKHSGYKRQNEEENLTAPMRKKAVVIVTDQEREEFVQNCVQFVARDLRSLDVINGDGFKELARSLIEIGAKHGTNNLSINDILPPSTTVSHSLHKLHATEVEKFVASLRPIIEKGRCAGTIDVWTESKTQRNFLTFSVHYLDTTWQFHTRILFTVELLCCDDSGNVIKNSAESILLSIGDKFEELNLERDLYKSITFTTDQVSNIQKALQYYTRINCAADVLNTILKHTFNKVTLQDRAPHVLDLITKCKTLVGYLKQTGKTRILETAVKQECSSRWNTEFDMLFSVHQNWNAIAEMLEKSGESHRLIGIEKYLIDRVFVFLEPFKSAALLFEGEKKPTIHLVLLHMHILKEKLQKLRNEESNYEMQFIASHCLDNVFSAMFYPDKIHKIAAFLWPEYKQLRYLSEFEREEVYTIVKEELHKISVMIHSEDSQSASSKIVLKSDMFNSDDMLAKYKDVHSTNNYNFESQVNVEMELYKNICYPSKDILHWWKIHGKEFPLLAKLARHILCIPASSAASERCFSSAKRVLEERRTNLKRENLDAILFLHSQQKQ